MNTLVFNMCRMYFELEECDERDLAYKYVLDARKRTGMEEEEGLVCFEKVEGNGEEPGLNGTKPDGGANSTTDGETKPDAVQEDPRSEGVRTGVKVELMLGLALVVTLNSF
jgi:hypothetical protein